MNEQEFDWQVLENFLSEEYYLTVAQEKKKSLCGIKAGSGIEAGGRWEIKTGNGVIEEINKF